MPPPSVHIVHAHFETQRRRHQESKRGYQTFSSGSGGARRPWPPNLVKIIHKKDGRIDFMFLDPPPLTRPLDPLLNFKEIVIVFR